MEERKKERKKEERKIRRKKEKKKGIMEQMDVRLSDISIIF